MKKIGIVSYNIYGNFTNYGSALQSWALHQSINRLGEGMWKSVLVDYCPDVLRDNDPLNPLRKMWDQDEESQRMCRLSLPAIEENYYKFDRFYKERFEKTDRKYTPENFEDIIEDEQLNAFVCGSDTIFCIDEFKGLEDGYFANYPCMKNGYSVAYAASFGDAHFTPETYEQLNEKLQNFKAIGLRENAMLSYVREHTNVQVERTIDPTLLLTAEDYEELAAPRQEEEKYLLLYVRRYNRAMEAFADKIAKEHGWKVVEISLRATNSQKHRMFYEAGVEEFLSLAKHAECVITNSFHGFIFAVQYQKPFYVFSREQGDTKIAELLDLLGLRERLLVTGNEKIGQTIDYEQVHQRIAKARESSLACLKNWLEPIVE